MIKNLKQNYTIPEDIVTRLRVVVGPRSRSAFVATAISEKLWELEQEQLRQSLIEGYQAVREEDAEINAEWENTTLDHWG
ncbi:MAG: hypothetical protein IH963_11685 [Chloroflexi bacterium]|nr:hypothetical protein [Chloroflexota bacterium]